MVSSAHPPFQKTNFRINRRIMPVAAAITAVILLSFALYFAFTTLAGNLVTDADALDVPRTGLQNGTTIHAAATEQQQDVTVFLKQLQQQYGARFSATEAGTYNMVRLNGSTVYRLQPRTTYQEAATTDAGIQQQITAQLDAHGIEYDVVKNNSAAVLLRKGEVVISWGGILYLPDVNAALLQKIDNK